jgi:ankyrin repeat protein
MEMDRHHCTSHLAGEISTSYFLIEKGADIHIRDNNKWNPLHLAAQNGHLDVVRLLIDIGIAVDIRNGTQMTSLGLASQKGQIEVSG